MNKPNIYYVIFSFFILLQSSVNANAESLTPKKIKQLEYRDKIISSHPYWLKLLHIKQVNSNDTDDVFIDDKRFYLSGENHFSPLIELEATIKELQTTPLTQCKFPARTLWLQKQLPWLKEKLPQYHCSEYQQWLTKLNTDSVILVFAATQLNSPSSMYGHTFLRFDPKNVAKHSTYLSYALNFGANIPSGEDDFSYAIRGLAGGYPGNFAANPYFEKIREYNQAENRDLWEYQLNLGPEEIERMLAHIWELRGINFDYFFLDENCAYRLLELIDIARPSSNTIKEFPAAVIPIDTVRIIQKHKFINEHYYRPSELTKLTHQISTLSSEEQAMMLALSSNIEILKSSDFNQKTPKVQNQISESAYRYLRFLNKGQQRDKKISQRSFTLLKELKKQRLNIEIPEPNRPELGHDTALWSLSAGKTNFDNVLNKKLKLEDNSFIDINYRASYHDLLDSISSYNKGMSLNMGKISARYYQDKEIKLQQAQLLNITSLSPRDAFFKPWSWQADIGIERLPVAIKNKTQVKEKLATQASGGGGLSYNPTKNMIVFAMVTGRLEYNKHLKNNWSVAPGVSVGYLHYWTYGTSLIAFDEYYFIDDIKRSSLSFNFNMPLAKNKALRLSAKKQRFDNNSHYSLSEFSLEYRQFF